jgi:hypothetical protein
MSIQLSNIEKCYECGMRGGEGHVCKPIEEYIEHFIKVCKDRLGMDEATIAEALEGGYYEPLREEKERWRLINEGLCNCDYDEEGELQPNGEAKFKCGDGYYCRLCAEYNNDVLVRGEDGEEDGFCKTCNCWVDLSRFYNIDGFYQPCRDCYVCDDDLTYSDTDDEVAVCLEMQACTNEDPCHDYDECSWCCQHVKPCECGCGFLGGTCNEYHERLLMEAEDVNVMNTEMCFDDNVWNIIKTFAGYSNEYPTDLPYYVKMLGIRGNYSMTKMKWKRVKTLEDYIDKLWDICWGLELDVERAFAPKQRPKTRDQMRIEWDSKYGEGSFDDDL